MVDPAAVARRIQQANTRERRALTAQRTAAQDAARHLADLLIIQYPEVETVWGFGSTFEAWRSYRAGSDIDLAIEHGDIVQLYPLVEQCGFPVDLVSLEDCDHAFARSVRARGSILARSLQEES